MPIAPPEEVLEFLKEIHDKFQAYSQNLMFDKAHPLHRNVIALYGSILEMTGSNILLANNKLVTGIPILLKSILEAYVDLTNLIKNPQYGYNLEINYLKQWLEILNEAKTGKNEYLQSLTDEPSLDETIAKWNRDKKKLENNGHSSLKISQKFMRAGLEKEYRSMYNSLCSDSHNNLRALVSRHIEIEDGDFSMVFYKSYTPEDSAVYIGTNAELLIRATQELHTFLKSSDCDRVNVYRVEFDRLRGD